MEQEHKKVDQLAAEKFALPSRDDPEEGEILRTEPELTWLMFHHKEAERLKNERDRAEQKEAKWSTKLSVARFTQLRARLAHV